MRFIFLLLLSLQLLFLYNCGTIKEVPDYFVEIPDGVEILLGDTVAYAKVYESVLIEAGWDSSVFWSDTNPNWVSLPDTTTFNGKFYRLTNILFSNILNQFVIYNPSHTSVRVQEAVIPNLVNDAMLFYCKTQVWEQTHIFFNTGGNIRTDRFSFDEIEDFDGSRKTHYLPLGITLNSEIQNQIDSWNNTTDVLKLNARMLKDTFEHGVSALPADAGSFAHFSGARVEVDTTALAGIGGNRVKRIWIYMADDTNVWDYYKTDTGWDTVYDFYNGGWQKDYYDFDFYVGTATYLGNGGDNYTPLLAAKLGQNFLLQSFKNHIEAYTFYFNYYKSVFGDTASLKPTVDNRYIWH